jgi:hypothetical protein
MIHLNYLLTVQAKLLNLRITVSNHSILELSPLYKMLEYILCHHLKNQT